MNTLTLTFPLLRRLRAQFTLAPDDLLRDTVYRRLWTSIFTSSLGGQISLLAVPLTAAVLLHATPTQMGLLTAIEALPFVLFSLPTGVWLDRVRKLPVYIGGELLLALAIASVPLAWWLGQLTMPWLYAVGFVFGVVNTVAGSASQIVLTQVVPRSRLVEAHAKNALASSTTDVAGPGAAGMLIKLLGAPVALAFTASLLLASALILRGIRVTEDERQAPGRFMQDLLAGVHFVRGQRLLVAMAFAVGGWHMCFYAAQVVQILYATRELGLGERAIGLCYAALGVGTMLGSVIGHRLVLKFGPGPTLLTGMALNGAGWLLVALTPAGPWGVAALVLMLLMFGMGAVFIFINFLAVRQAVTPGPMLGRMTSTMRWLILLPAAPGALLGGWIGEHVSLRATLACAGIGVLLLALAAVRHGLIASVKKLPRLDDQVG